MILPPFGRAGVGFPSSLREGRGGLLHHLLGRAGVGFSKLWLPRKSQKSIKMKINKYQTKKQNNLFCFAIRA